MGTTGRRQRSVARSTPLQRSILLRTHSGNLQQQVGLGARDRGRTVRRGLFLQRPPLPKTGTTSKRNSRKQDSSNKSKKKQLSHQTVRTYLTDERKKRFRQMLDIVPRADHPPQYLAPSHKNQRWATTKDFDEQDDEEADPARLAIKRAEAAKKLCEAIKELSVADVEGPSITAGWAVLSKSAARALDFDGRITPSNTLQKATPQKHRARHNGSTGWAPS